MAASRVYLPITRRRELGWGEVCGSQLLTSEKAIGLCGTKVRDCPLPLNSSLSLCLSSYRVMLISNVGMIYTINPAMKSDEILKMVLFNDYPRNQAEGILIFP